MAFKVQLIGRPRVRRELRAACERDVELVVVGESGDAAEACAAAEALCPDVIVIDGGIARGAQSAAIAALKQCRGGARVLFCSAQPTADEVRGALGAGASGVIGMQQHEREIAAAVRIIAEGGSYLPPTTTRPRGTAT